GPRPQGGRRDSAAARAAQHGVQEDHRHGDARSACGRAGAPRPAARQGLARSRDRRGACMSLFSLVLINLGRNKLRTLLTLVSVTVALFLFCALGGILDTLKESIRVGSQTRLITRNAVSLVFPIPLSYRERIAAVPGVRDIAIQQWFGGQDPKDPHNFFAQFGVDEHFWPIYTNDMAIVEASPPQVATALPAGVDPKLAAYMAEQNACVVGRNLMTKNHWTLGQT